MGFLAEVHKGAQERALIKRLRGGVFVHDNCPCCDGHVQAELKKGQGPSIGVLAHMARYETAEKLNPVFSKNTFGMELNAFNGKFPVSEPHHIAVVD